MPRREASDHKGERQASARHQKKPPAVPAPEKSGSSVVKRQLSIELMQSVLDVFQTAFSSRFNSFLPESIREVKQHLYNRDFDNAFGRENLLEAYAMRWSPSRALAYAQIFCSLPKLSEIWLSMSNLDSDVSLQNTDSVKNGKPHSKLLVDSPSSKPQIHGTQEQSTRIVCVGAGAGAELVGLAASLNHFHECSIAERSNDERDSDSARGVSRPPIDVKIIDIANWKPVISKLHAGLTTTPPISPYASQEMKAETKPLTDSLDYKLHYVRSDILGLTTTELASTFTDVTLVTLMFTLNELYSASISATTKFLLALTTILSRGALLLIVDSPGTYSTVKLGTTLDVQKEENQKKYPMQWLVNHTLLESATIRSGQKENSRDGDRWEKLTSSDAEWFRFPEKLNYPIALEDMRYQIHLYHRL